MRLHEIPFLFNNQMSAHNCYPGFSLCRFVLNVGFILYSYTRGVIRGACRCILFSARCFRYTSECVWQLLNIPRGWRERLKGAVSHRVISLGFLGGGVLGHFGLIWLANISVRSALASETTKKKKKTDKQMGPMPADAIKHVFVSADDSCRPLSSYSTITPFTADSYI